MAKSRYCQIKHFNVGSQTKAISHYLDVPYFSLQNLCLNLWFVFPRYMTSLLSSSTDYFSDIYVISIHSLSMACFFQICQFYQYFSQIYVISNFLIYGLFFLFICYICTFLLYGMFFPVMSVLLGIFLYTVEVPNLEHPENSS